MDQSNAVKPEAAEEMVVTMPRDSQASWSAWRQTPQSPTSATRNRRRTSSTDDIGSPTSPAEIVRLEDEFRHVLSKREIEVLAGLRSASATISVERSSSDSNAWGDDHSSVWSYVSQLRIHETNLFPTNAISDLHAMASRMTAAGHGSDCVQVYASVRKTAVEAALRRLGVEKLGIDDDDVQRLEWEAVEAAIGRWIQALRCAVRGVFASERRLCFLVFRGLPLHTAAARDVAFADTVKGAAQQLLGFAEVVSVGRRSPEKLLRILDMHDALADLLPDVSDIFAASKLTESICMQAAKVKSSLADAVRGTLSEFDDAVLRDASKNTPVPGGAVHPFTRYVMNYINLVCDYNASLSKVITSQPPPACPEIVIAADSPIEPFAARLVSIIVALERNIEIKASLYTEAEAALSHLFLMNNVHHIVHKVMDSSELRELIGDEHLKRLTCKYRQAADGYLRSGWSKILDSLREDDLHVSSGCSFGVSNVVLQERFKGFSAMFWEAHKVQSRWFVPDTQLREELRISVSEKLLLAYRAFLGRFQHRIEKGRNQKLCTIKYTVEDLETAMEDFFEGTTPSRYVRFAKGIPRINRYMRIR